MNRSSFWRALERLSDGAVMLEWKRGLGSDSEHAGDFLQLSHSAADTYPCTNPVGCGCPHRIEEASSGGWVAVCEPDESCPPILVNPEERRVFHINTKLLCERIASALGLRRTSTTSATRTRALRVGVGGATGFEVCLMFPSDAAWMAREVERLFGMQPDPFVLLTPTGIHCSPEVKTALRRQLCMHIALRDILELKPGGVLEAVESAGASLVEFERRLGESKGMAKTVERIERGLQAVAAGNLELLKENEELKQLQSEGYLKFSLRVDGDDFRAFAVIMALGNRKAAAEFLGVPIRSFYDRVDKWSTRGKEYQKMARAVDWRKKVGRKITVPLGDTIQSGDAGEAEDNPETIKNALTRLRHNEVDSRDFPALLGEILEALQNMNAKNWPALKAELSDIIKDELSQ